MSRRQLPLSRARLHLLLSRFEPGVRIEMKGGYDSGVFFSFVGRHVGPVLPEEREIGGRIVRPWGFSSEAMEMSTDEKRLVGTSTDGIDRFFARCERRRLRFERWARQHDATGPSPPDCR